MVRVLYSAFDVVPSPKGATTHIMHFVRGLVNAGFSVHLMTPGDGILPAQDVFEGATVTGVAPEGSANFLARALAFGEAVMAHVANGLSYDVVHFRSVWSGFPLVRERGRCGNYATVFEVNGLPSVELKYHYPALRGSPVLAKIREQELAALHGSDRIICPSDVTRAFLCSLGVPAARTRVIPNGVNPGECCPYPLADAGDRMPVLLYLGTLAEWQGLDLLINAVARLRAEQPVALRLVGKGSSRQRKQLARLIRKQGLEDTVSLEPAVPHHEVPALIAGADICVAPLALDDRNVTQGCCPLKVLEYMACGRPLVATNLPVVRELVREDVDGLLYAPGDAIDLAAQLLRLLRDPQLAARLAANAAAARPDAIHVASGAGAAVGRV